MDSQQVDSSDATKNSCKSGLDARAVWLCMRFPSFEKVLFSDQKDSKAFPTATAANSEQQVLSLIARLGYLTGRSLQARTPSELEAYISLVSTDIDALVDRFSRMSQAYPLPEEPWLASAEVSVGPGGIDAIWVLSRPRGEYDIKQKLRTISADTLAAAVRYQTPAS
ncbi:hypothetical protein BD324DRAFT_317908 [Kockovaella imperatae]|uniref:Uncharacterized protein n=1 Tax=Kockovaella imperatae TaxID=4999 RepID=A0A1Y1UNU2_9TREE|nr:hypothetical protein BD324DRAFT_317908 [Kockovaella imperatae]ORX39207.1 hypothetical protein BD324DRAFT_317908 [Kockovaella imperatae]